MPDREVADIIERLELVTRLRWVAITVALLCFLVINVVSGLVLDVVPSLLVASAVLVYNLISHFHLRSISRNPDYTKTPALVTLFTFGIFDLVALSAGIYFTGGVESPYLFLLLIYILAVAAVLTTAIAYAAATLAVLLVILIEFLVHGIPTGRVVIPGSSGFSEILTPGYLLSVRVPELTILLLFSSMTYLGVYIVGTVARRLNNKQQEVIGLLNDQNKNLERLAALHQIGREISSLTSLETVLNLIVHKAKELFGTDMAYLALKESDSEAVRISVTCGENAEALRGLVLQPGQGLGGLVMVLGEPVIVSDYATDPRLVGSPLSVANLVPLKSGIAAPLSIGTRRIGALYVFNRISTYFGSADAEILWNLANQAAIAIENARLYASVREASVTDGLTGLYNSRFLQDRLRSEMARADRYGGRFGLIIADCDSFKEVNDQFGHPAGDQLLIKLAGLIRDNVREMDVVTRYGGDEFVILLPEADIPEAYQVAERIRVKVARTPIYFNGLQLNVSLSLGITRYPGESTEGEDVMRKADHALYRAKHLGKNMVCAYEITANM